MKNEQVRLLQQMLATDKDIYPEQLTTGYYGTLTQRAVERFQCRYMSLCKGSPYVNGYGLAGPNTRKRLNELYAKPSQPPAISEGMPLEKERLIEELKAQLKLLQAKLMELLKQLAEALQRQLRERMGGEEDGGEGNIY